jgi:DNA-binding MarR family transcriptional regulator
VQGRRRVVKLPDMWNHALMSTSRTSEQPRLTYLVGRLDRALRKRINQALGPLNLSLPQYTTLSVLHARGELSNAQLANRVFISPQAMNEVVRELENKKLLTRRPDPSHGRIVQLLLTPHGLEVLRGCDAEVHRLEQSMLTGLDAGERESMRVALAACVKALEEMPEETAAAK